ncbi:ABC transporter ATP-binding protein [Nocardia macrotermitis]|uniref:Aliphatic sulfonates import ATP-binding protein SsuB n=1 Tax=Nocardia macrotermitis TaxID=2585198 RepID=A0A7K0D5D3_9NOCA|nr:ABC transporter ATP-binding protein [Nocardia macrotermitis]MQY20522.1 Aliphatic sulfonates import ATP-binding protein SsuB [Nocardia macrotermitis]
MATNSGGLTPVEPSGDPGSGVRLRGVTRSFAGRAVLDNVDLTIPEGQFVALLGKSGSGKSTLLRALAGIDHGVAGAGLLRVPTRTSMVFQDSRLLPWKRILPNVLFGQPRSRRAAASELLGEVGLAGREKAWPGELSGGEQQRAALARALVGEPDLLLADEPFGALDALTRIRMHALLRRLIEVHRPTVLLVTHDVDEAITLAQRVVILDRGRIEVDIEIDIDGPRDPSQPQFQQIRRALLSALGADPLAA